MHTLEFNKAGNGWVASDQVEEWLSELMGGVTLADVALDSAPLDAVERGLKLVYAAQYRAGVVKPCTCDICGKDNRWVPEGEGFVCDHSEEDTGIWCPIRQVRYVKSEDVLVVKQEDA